MHRDVYEKITLIYDGQFIHYKYYNIIVNVYTDITVFDEITWIKIILYEYQRTKIE